MDINDELLDELLADYKNPEDLIGNDGILKKLKKALIERAMKGELTHYLGYEKSSRAGKNSGNARNGGTKKRIKTEQGMMNIETPRDRSGTFEPQLVKKHQTRFEH